MNQTSSNIVYAMHNITQILSEQYVPSNWRDSKKLLNESFKVLARSAGTFFKEHRALPTILILKDHVAFNIVHEYLEPCKQVLATRLVEQGLVNFRVLSCSPCGSHDAVATIVATQSPGYTTEELLQNLLEVKEKTFQAGDSYSKYLVYRLEPNEE